MKFDKIKIHPLFIIYIIYLLIFRQAYSVIVFFSCVLLHELGHSVCAKRLGYSLNKMVFMPFGVSLNYNNNIIEPCDEIKIAIAGPLVNFVLAIFTISIWWLFPCAYSYTYIFCYCNIVCFVFNLLPCFPLDGGRVLAGFLTLKFNRKKAIKASVLFNVFLCVILVCVFIVGCFLKIYNMNLIIIAFFLFVSILEPKNSSSYTYYSFFDCIPKKISKVKTICVNSNEKLFKVVSKMSRGKLNLVYVMDKYNKIKLYSQFAVFDIIAKRGSNASFDEVYKN